MTQADSLDELAAAIGVPADALTQTVDEVERERRIR